MAVAVAESEQGLQQMLVATSEPRGYLRPGVVLQSEEGLVPGLGHAERNLVDYAARARLGLLAIGATRPICSACLRTIEPTGAEVCTPVKRTSDED